MQNTVNEARNEGGSVTVVLPGLVRMRRARGYDSCFQRVAATGGRG